MDNETRQWIIAIVSVTIAPVLTYFIAVRRLKWLGLTKDNVFIVSERAEFRKDQIDRAKSQDEKINAQQQTIENLRLDNNRLYRRMARLEAILLANGLEMLKDKDDNSS